MDFAKLSDKALKIMRNSHVLVPSPLLMDSNGIFLEKYQQLLTDYYCQSGASAVIAGAHTGQFARQDLGLYKSWLQLVNDVIDPFVAEGKMFRMAAVGGSQAMQMAEIAREQKQDIVMVAPSAFGDRDEIESIKYLKDMARIIPVIDFYLQPAVGGKVFSPLYWLNSFDVAYGAKSAPFNRELTDELMHAAMRSDRLDQLVMVTGNDDNIVGDLIKTWRHPDYPERFLRMTAGLLGHFATDTHAAVELVDFLKCYRDDPKIENPYPVDVDTLANQVTFMNFVLFDTICIENKPPYENCVYGVHHRLYQLGLIPESTDIRWIPKDKNQETRIEAGRPNLDNEIKSVYDSMPHLTDDKFVEQILPELREKYGVE